MATATTDPGDRDLAVRFRESDPEAIRELYRRYSGALYTLSRAMLSDPDHAHDAVQQTFVKAWRAADRFDPDRSLAAWLYQICRRVCIDQYRREHRSRAAVTPTGAVADVAVDGSSMEREWTAWELRRAIDGLPASERDVIRLAHLDGWSLPDIAEHLGIPLGTVKSRTHRAYQRLARSLRHLRPVADQVA